MLTVLSALPAAGASPVKRCGAPEGALSGRTIAVWQSHGYYFEPTVNRWEWQRARLFGTVEDLYTQSYVMPFLMPMLENAGAYVMSPRERDVNSVELIVDGDRSDLTSGRYDEHSGKHKWTDAPGSGFAYRRRQLLYGQNPFADGKSRMVKSVKSADRMSTATWSADVPTAGDYAVYVSYKSLPESTTGARYRVRSAAGDVELSVNQRMGGGTWIYLGHFPLEAGYGPIVELDNFTADGGTVTADAVKIGGGMGNVARAPRPGQFETDDVEPRVSGCPRFTEGARYWLQWAGAPVEVYSESAGENDYTDDFRSRGHWVNWLMGGSKQLPDSAGLAIPVDAVMAFHSDAGTTQSDTETVGTMGIFFTDKGGKFADGRSRTLNRALADSVVTSVVRDIRATRDPMWTRRKMRDRSYVEARLPETPTMLLELLSHQNFADMKLGLDPEFRFMVSRAVYKGILRFLAGSKAVVQPLPVRDFAIAFGDSRGEFILSWRPTYDDLEPTAIPTGYIIEERVGDGVFRKIAEIDYATSYTVHVRDHHVHSYRITAVNSGGCSFPGEVLALCDRGPDSGRTLIVNGFTRVSGPDAFSAGSLAGFTWERDHGVPYVRDIAFTGNQTEFRRAREWTDDDNPGFGASCGDFEGRVIAGNTFDFVCVHGEALADAGMSFVSSSLAAFEADTLSPAPDVLDVILGKQGGQKYQVFTPALMARIYALAAGGTDLLVSGSYVATGLDATSAGRLFAADVLGIKWLTSGASRSGRVEEVRSRFPEFSGAEFHFLTELNEHCYAVESPDALEPHDKSAASVIMRYSENNIAAATAFAAPGHRAVTLGFPFETIADASARKLLMHQILQFFHR